jgi:hypothetical protein
VQVDQRGLPHECMVFDACVGEEDVARGRGAKQDRVREGRRVRPGAAVATGQAPNTAPYFLARNHKGR